MRDCKTSRIKKSDFLKSTRRVRACVDVRKHETDAAISILPLPVLVPLGVCARFLVPIKSSGRYRKGAKSTVVRARSWEHSGGKLSLLG